MRRVYAASFSPDGSRIVTASDDKTARLWDAATGKELVRLAHEAPSTAAAFSPDGARVLTASEDKTARLWDAATGKELARLAHEGSVIRGVLQPGRVAHPDRVLGQDRAAVGGGHGQGACPLRP